MQRYLCPDCGKELDEKMIAEKTCSYCGAKFYIEPENISSSISTQTNQTENQEEDNDFNPVSNVFRVVAWLLLIIGSIGAIVLSVEDARYGADFNVGRFFIYEIAVALSFMFILGWAEIIRLLHEINKKQDKKN